MPHIRVRYLVERYQELIKFSPLVGILGHRQAGKTTFLETHAKHYYTFDDEDTLNEAKKSAKQFIKRLTHYQTAIDESQLVETLFPALKERVRINKRPGQFILSGSVRFTSKASIRESLTGRIQYLEMLPMTIPEINGEPFPKKLRKILSTSHLPSLIDTLSLSTKTMQFFEKEIESYRGKGGLPGLCFIRKVQTRNDKILDQLKTILDRDLRQIYSSQLPFDVIFGFIKELSIQQGNSFRFQHYKKTLGLSPITQKKLLYALESIFLIRKIAIEGAQNNFTYLLEDQAESHYLSKEKLTLEKQWIHLLYRNLRAEFFYRTDEPMETFQFVTQNGKSIPLAFRNENSCVGFIYTQVDQISRDLRGVASSFLKRYSNSKIIYVSNGRSLAQIDERSLLCPLSCLVSS